MTLPITNPTLAQLNALGGGFPPSQNFQLGTFLNSLTASVGSGGAGVVYSPGNPSPPAGTYLTFPEAFAAAAAIVGPPVWLEIDNTYAACSVPAGTYDFENNIWLHAAQRQPLSTPLDLDDGVVFQNLNHMEGSILLRSNSSSPVITTTNGLSILFMALNAAIQAQGTAPFISVGVNGAQVLAAITGGVVLAGAQPVVDITDPAAILIVPTLPAGSLQDNTVSGAAGTIGFLAFSTGYQAGFIQPGFLGAIVTQYGTFANLAGYAPAVPANWVGAPPENTQQALDRIAAMLGPIA